jgi:hypothetical protein
VALLVGLLVALAFARSLLGVAQGTGRGSHGARHGSYRAGRGSQGAGGGSRGAGGGPVGVSVDAHHPHRPIPGEFLGLSFELSSVGQIAEYSRRGDLPGLLRSLGPGVLRFGGASADTRVAWTDRVTPRPEWASAVLDAGELRELRELAERSGWPIVLTIGLAHYDPVAAAREAAAAKAALGRWLVAIELGNEPDSYPRHGFRPAAWSFSGYRTQVAAYRRAISTAAPGIPLEGPDVSGSSAFGSWGRREAIEVRPMLLTGHHYPLGCHSRVAPSIPRLLSARIRRLEGVSLHRYMSVSHASAIGVRIDETNSVSCGGRAGISNTFAAALWAVDYIARSMAAGVSGINFQGNPANCLGYTPVCAPTAARLRAGSLSAQPEWYALLLASRLIGDRPVHTTLTRPTLANVDVTTLIAPDGGLRFVIVDDDPPGARDASVALHVGRGFAGAAVMPLTAPSPAASSGVELGGEAVRSDGSWRESRRLPHRPNHAGVITLTVSPSSAALATVARSSPTP